MLLDEVSLIGDPLLLYLGDLVLELVDLLLDVVLLGLERAGVLVLPVLGQLRQLPVESVHLVLLFGDLDVALLDVCFEALDLLLFLLQLVDQVVQLLLQQFVLRLGVQVVDSHS